MRALKPRIKTSQSGFTLLEVLIVVAIIAILAGIIILAINPTKQLGAARNTKRQADLNTIMSAVYQYSIDNNGAMPGTIIGTAKEICFDATACTGGIDLWSTIVTSTSKYLPALPCDPAATCSTGNSTKYTILQDATTKRLTVATLNFDPPAAAVFSITR